MQRALNHIGTLTSAWRRSGSAAALSAGVKPSRFAKSIRRLQRLAGGLLLLWSCAGCGAEPAFTFADGDTAALEDWHGRWLVINYWAEWCAPCRDEIPELNALHRAQSEVAVVGVNFDGVSDDQLSALIARMGIEFPVLTTDPRPHWGYDAPSALPMTVLITPDGAFYKRMLGPQTQASLQAAMQ